MTARARNVKLALLAGMATVGAIAPLHLSLGAIAASASTLSTDIFDREAPPTVPTPTDWTVLVAAVLLLTTVALHYGLQRLWQQVLIPRVRSHFAHGTSESDDPKPPDVHDLIERAMRTALLLTRTVLWLVALWHLTGLFLLTREWSRGGAEVLLDSFTTPLMALGGRQYSLVQLLALLAMLVLLILASKAMTDLFRSRILELAGINRGAQEAIAVIFRYGLIFVGTLVLLQVWGLDISSLAILASALSVGIGFGLQDIAKNFGSGLVLVFERPIQVGDFVEVGDFQGTVERIGARSTVIRTLDQVSIIVPNSRFLEKEVINWSHDNPVSRLHIPVGVAYGADVPKVRSLLLDASKGQARVLSYPAPQVFFKGFGDSSLDFELLVWTREPSRQILIKSDLYFQIEHLFRKNRVEIPFPQRDLHLRTNDLALSLSPELADSLQQWIAGTNGAAASPSHAAETEADHN